MSTPHRWDDDTPDTRERHTLARDSSSWNQTGDSTFSDPSRIGERRRRALRRRRQAVALLVGLSVAALTAGGVSLILRHQRDGE